MKRTQNIVRCLPILQMPCDATRGCSISTESSCVRASAVERAMTAKELASNLDDLLSERIGLRDTVDAMQGEQLLTHPKLHPSIS
jgi:hypothetical protein